MPVTALLYSKNNVLLDTIHPMMEIKLLEINENKKNRILIDEKMYYTLPMYYSFSTQLYVYTKKQLDNITTFNSIDYIFENGFINETYIIGVDLFYALLNRKCIDNIEIINVNDKENITLSTLPLLLFNEYKQISHTKLTNTISLYNTELIKWTKPIHPEMSYLKMLQNVIENGSLVKSRSEDTLSIFGQSIEFDLQKGFPLLTTKKMFFNGIVKELLWFLKGHTNANELKEQKVNIWNGNTTREYLNSNGLTDYPEGCCGPIYGYQWRFFNAPYDIETMMPIANEKNNGVDQLMNCIDLIQNDPTSRRIIMSGWNPCQLKEMCLPPCHVMYHFNVRDGKLSCQMYQRSADLFLGLPFNIASTALFTHLIAKMCCLIPDKIRICIGDAHIYTSHIENVIKQIKRQPLPFCNIEIDNPMYEAKEQLEKWKPENIRLKNYMSHDKLESKMVA
jgi:thymidylate synthase